MQYIFYCMKKYLIILAVLMFIFTIGVYSADTQENINMPPINETNESALFGCCSIVFGLSSSATAFASPASAGPSANRTKSAGRRAGKHGIDAGQYCAG